jgi:hypothetical protein
MRQVVSWRIGGASTGVAADTESESVDVEICEGCEGADFGREVRDFFLVTEAVVGVEVDFRVGLLDFEVRGVVEARFAAVFALVAAFVVGFLGAVFAWLSVSFIIPP